MPQPEALALRRCVLAVSVMGDLDVDPRNDGFVLPGPPRLHVTWSEVLQALAGRDPETSGAWRRLDRWLRLRLILAYLDDEAAPLLRAAARVVALPPGHVDHLGQGWVREPLPGGALDLGMGVQGLHRLPELAEGPVGHVLGPLGTGDEVTSLPTSVLASAGIDSTAWWPDVRRHADRMGALAAARLTRDAGSSSGDVPGPGGSRAPRAVIRPVGGCDVLALLSSSPLRAHLARGDGTGMRAVAVPARRRGWCDLSGVDAAFVSAAWTATSEGQRGVSRALLVTRDEVAVAR